MKNAVVILMIVLLFGSCTNKDVPNYDALNHVISLMVVDEALHDRLNPKSSSYFGEEYIQGIKFFNKVNDEKSEYEPPYYYASEGPDPYFWRIRANGIPIKAEDVERMQLIQPPYVWHETEHSSMWVANGTTHGFYFIRNEGLSLLTEEEGEMFSYLYIQFPDGSEDEIKAREYKNKSGSVGIFDKIWINGDLAYENKFDPAKNYFNPKYYPDLVPLYDKDGKKLKDLGMERGLSFFIQKIN